MQEKDQVLIVPGLCLKGMLRLSRRYKSSLNSSIISLEYPLGKHYLRKEDAYFDSLGAFKMMKATKIRITKCYLIEVCDKDGNELESEYSFINYQEVKKEAQQMKDDYNRRNNYV